MPQKIKLQDKKQLLIIRRDSRPGELPKSWVLKINAWLFIANLALLITNLMATIAWAYVNGY